MHVVAARMTSHRKRLFHTGHRGSRILPRIASAVCIIVCAATAVTSSATAAAANKTTVTTSAIASSRFITVTNLRSSGPGSLRAAIRRADAASSRRVTTISFSVHGIIRLASQLPAISRRVVINARSAPTYVSGGPPVVEIDCRAHAGLRFAAGSGGSQLLAVAVDNASGNGVTLNAGSITINDDYVGLNLAGAKFGNRGAGVYASATSWRDRIGLNRSGASDVVANVISGNTRSGIVFHGSSDNTVVSNRIGTNAAGTSAIANGGNGLSMTARSSGNEIGGTDFVDPATGQANDPTGDKGQVAPVFVVPPLGNLISGNRQNGVLIEAGSRHNVLNGNFVGTTADGDAAIGNRGNGVWIDRASDNSLIGCAFVNNPFVYYNVLSGNGANGLRITNSRNAVVQGNFLGIGANNTATVRNRLDGILVDGSSANTQVGGVIPLGNVSAGNGLNGIEVAAKAHGFVTFNTFGGLLAFKGAAPNGKDGLLITSTGGDNLARTNVFSGNRQNGIELSGNASGVIVDPDIAGLTTNGSSALPNGRDGLLIDDNAHDNVIGGTRRSVIPQNTFAGNLGYGIAIVGTAHNNRVFNSFVGTRLLGVKPLGNHRGGVLLGGAAYRNSIGNARSRPSNIISANRGNGVMLLRGTHDNRVINNYIGLDRFGRSLPNTGRAIVNRGRRNTIRGNRTHRRHAASAKRDGAPQRVVRHSVSGDGAPRPLTRLVDQLHVRGLQGAAATASTTLV
jgi:parallel beta-helix repeat protein